MSAGKTQAPPRHVKNPALLRQLQMTHAVAKCIEVAADHAEGIDLADAVAGLVILLGMATAELDVLEVQGTARK